MAAALNRNHDRRPSPRRSALLALATAAGTLALPPASHAECFCEFINGVLQPMCGSSLELRPRCETPVRAWSVPVLAPPPLRVESCKPAALCNQHGFCRTKWVCD
jgi:hypothetical protein